MDEVHFRIRVLKRELIIGLMIFVAVAAVALMFAWPHLRARAEGILTRKSDLAAQVFGDERTLEAVRSASEVIAQRSHFHGQRPFDLASYDLRGEVAVPSEAAHELKGLLLHDSSYNWRVAKPCAPRYGVVLTFRDGSHEIHFALCFECNTFGVFDSRRTNSGRVNSEDDFDPVRKEFVKIVQSLFPDDAEIQSLK